jgi:hypothetical protein
MSRIETLKEQYPHLNITLLDILSEIDGTKSHKYLQLLCKVFSRSHTLTENKQEHFIGDKDYFIQQIDDFLSLMEIDLSQNTNTKYVKYKILDMLYRKEEMEVFKQFQKFNERGLVKNNDLTKYSDISQIMTEVSICEMKIMSKELEKEIIKEYEDDRWLLLRPLSFEASSKYGSGTKWCTTYKREKEYFFKYIHNGTLVYFINKETGYKVAMHKEIYEGSQEVSFWDASDKRNDFISLDFDEYLVPIIKRIIKDGKKNTDFLDKDRLFNVASECNSLMRLFESDNIKASEGILVVNPPDPIQPIREYEELEEPIRVLELYENPPNMRA